MGVSGFILKDKDKYLIDNMIGYVEKAVFNAQLYMSSLEKFYNEGSRKLSYVTLGIYDYIAFHVNPDDWGNEYVNQGECINFYIETIEEECADYEAFSWISKESKLYQVAYVEKVRNSEKIIFKFIHEYLKLNPDDYFWVEDDWVYTLEDMERLSKLPFDEYWCYKNPKLI